MSDWKQRVAGMTVAMLMSACTNIPVKFSYDGVLTDLRGMTLYTFDKDVAGSGKSVCNGPCAKIWLPLAAGADAKPGGYWSIITRDDGSKQWTYDGKPVHYWVKDQKPGDRTGDGVNNAWHIIKADPPPPLMDP